MAKLLKPEESPVFQTQLIINGLRGTPVFRINTNEVEQKLKHALHFNRQM